MHTPTAAGAYRGSRLLALAQPVGDLDKAAVLQRCEMGAAGRVLPSASRYGLVSTLAHRLAGHGGGGVLPLSSGVPPCVAGGGPRLRSSSTSSGGGAGAPGGARGW